MKRPSASRALRPLGTFALATVLPAAAHAKAPLGYLRGYGPKAYPVVTLTWALLIVSIAVVVIVTVLVAIGIWRRRATVGSPLASVPVERGGNGLAWIYIGLGLTSIVLVGSLVWTVVVLAAVNGPASKPSLTIEVTGQQWWWKARYLSDDPTRVFNTANEIHIPTGQPVRIELVSADVIHAFWVPSLTGKMQTIPGQTNVTWLEASRPGRYRGQCTQYCGEQHAHMAFFVVAESPADFESWWNAQLGPAPAPASPQAAKGETEFAFHCGACHSVRGTPAGGTVAPDLTHLMSRSTIAAGTLPNNVGNLLGWIADPPAIKPGTLMPVLYLSGPQLADIGTYLQTLK
jgi:cytochrome c oxidase subunit II